MADLTTISLALSSLKTATEIAKVIKDSGASLEQAEVKLKIAELVSALAEAKIELANVQAELLEKDKAIYELQQALKTKSNLQWEKPYYWVVDGEKKDGPFCQKCFDSMEKLIRLQGGGKGLWICQECKNSVRDGNYVEPSIRQHRNHFP